MREVYKEQNTYFKALADNVTQKQWNCLGTWYLLAS